MDNGIKQVIETRSSVRVFADDKFDDKLMQVIDYVESINNLTGPFGNKINISLIDKQGIDGDVKLGTYGMIKNANFFLVVSAVESDNIELDLGYLFELVVLQINALGLGAVWMAGTYNKKQFASQLELEDNEEIAIVCPFGVPASKVSAVRKMLSNKSKKRKPFETLFFDGEALKPMLYTNGVDYMQALKMVQLAPSSMGSEPWRVVKVGKAFHFYNKGNKRGADINIGIALAHFELMMNELGHSGVIEIIENDLLANYKFTWLQTS